MRVKNRKSLMGPSSSKIYKICSKLNRQPQKNSNSEAEDPRILRSRLDTLWDMIRNIAYSICNVLFLMQTYEFHFPSTYIAILYSREGGGWRISSPPNQPWVKWLMDSKCFAHPSEKAPNDMIMHCNNWTSCFVCFTNI